MNFLNMALSRAWNLAATRRRFARIRDLLANLPRHKRVIAALSAPCFHHIRLRQPQLKFKYLHEKHLVDGFSSSDRADAMIHHYNIMSTQLLFGVQEYVFGDGFSVWTYESDPGIHTLTLRFSHPTDNEGELTLEYSFNDLLIHVLSFTLIPGSLIGTTIPTVLLISRIQSMCAQVDECRGAMKTIRGLAPAAVLMASAQGVAIGMGLTHIVGVPAARQVCNAADKGHFHSQYDDVFKSLGASKTNDFFVIKLPFFEKPIGEIKSSNRARTRYQRDLKNEIVSLTRRRIAQSF